MMRQKTLAVTDVCGTCSVTYGGMTSGVFTPLTKYYYILWQIAAPLFCLFKVTIILLVHMKNIASILKQTSCLFCIFRHIYPVSVVAYHVKRGQRLKC